MMEFEQKISLEYIDVLIETRVQITSHNNAVSVTWITKDEKERKKRTDPSSCWKRALITVILQEIHSLYLIGTHTLL